MLPTTTGIHNSSKEICSSSNNENMFFTCPIMKRDARLKLVETLLPISVNLETPPHQTVADKLLPFFLIFTKMEQNAEIELNGEEHKGESEEKKKKKRKLVHPLFNESFLKNINVDLTKVRRRKKRDPDAEEDEDELDEDAAQLAAFEATKVDLMLLDHDDGQFLRTMEWSIVFVKIPLELMVFSVFFTIEQLLLMVIQWFFTFKPSLSTVLSMVFHIRTIIINGFSMLFLQLSHCD